MAFDSIGFLFGIFPIFLILYFLSKPAIRIYEILLMSLWFYYTNDPDHLWLLAVMIAVNYLISMGIARSEGKRARMFLWAGIIGNAGVLFFYKYIPFLSSRFGITFPVMPQGMMAGVSFIVFGMIAYLADVYHGKAHVPGNPVRFADYAAMFPKVMMGPITRYPEMEGDFAKCTITAEDIGNGAKRSMAGFVKKVLIADHLAMLISQLKMGGQTIPVDQGSTVTALWLGSIAYSLQLFFDFSGYSDMAIGIARMLGFHFRDNFDHPYCCSGFTDFWRRWHISLSEWFRDYVYIPLGGSRMSEGRNVLNLLAVWVLTGVWHGAGLTFLTWGMVFFVMILLERYVIRPKRLGRAAKLGWRVFTLAVINFNWVIFSHQTLREGIDYCLGMFGAYGNRLFADVDVRLLREYGIYLALGIVLCLPIDRWIRKRVGNEGAAAHVYTVAAPVIYGALFIWAISAALLGYHNPFMYQVF